MKFRFALIGSIACASSVSAQSVDAAVSGMRTEWEMTANYLRKAAEQMPEPDFGYRPESVRSFRDMLKHITATQVVLCGVALGEKPLRDGVETGAMTKADVAKELQDSAASRIARLLPTVVACNL